MGAPSYIRALFNKPNLRGPDDFPYPLGKENARPVLPNLKTLRRSAKRSNNAQRQAKAVTALCDRLMGVKP